MEIWEEITKNLNALVKNSPKTNMQIAAEAGVHTSAISHYLSGKAFPNYETLKKLCQVLDCTYEDVLGSL